MKIDWYHLVPMSILLHIVSGTTLSDILSTSNSEQETFGHETSASMLLLKERI